LKLSTTFFYSYEKLLPLLML